MGFYELAVRTRRRKLPCILVGYLKRWYDADAPGGVGAICTFYNPQHKGVPVYWAKDDFLILVGHDDAERCSSSMVVVR